MFDYNTLESETVETFPSRDSKVLDTPFPKWIRQSREAFDETGTGATLKITVPADEASTTESLIRKAASLEGVGIRVRKTDAGDGKVAVLFRVAAKRAVLTDDEREAKALKVATAKAVREETGAAKRGPKPGPRTK